MKFSCLTTRLQSAPTGVCWPGSPLCFFLAASKLRGAVREGSANIGREDKIFDRVNNASKWSCTRAPSPDYHFGPKGADDRHQYAALSLGDSVTGRMQTFATHVCPSSEFFGKNGLFRNGGSGSVFV